MKKNNNESPTRWAGWLAGAVLLTSLALVGRSTGTSPAGSAAGTPVNGGTAGLPEDLRAESNSPPPEDCEFVEPGEGLERAIAEAEDGATLCLRPGHYEGTFRIERPVTITGPTAAVVENPGHGSTFFIASDDVQLSGFTIAGSGDRYTKQDAGIFVSESDHVRLEGLTLRDVLFGITSQKVNNLVIRHNDLACRTKRTLGLRGDGIRLWETRRSLVAGNRMIDCRDLVVWYSPENVIEHNHVQGGRYGTHFMYSSRNVVRHNRFVGNVVGIFAMYSRNIRIDSNILADSSGAAGVGLGLKESGNLEVTRNRFIHNTQGVYSDTSPLHRDDHNLFAHNTFRLGNSAVVFHSSPQRNRFTANTFKDNSSLVAVEGGGDATGIQWRRNFYGRYAGYDFDEDGLGDIPFELRSLSEQLLGRYPKLKVLTGTPAMFLIEAASRVSPMYRPKKLMEDPRPLMAPVGDSRAAPRFDEMMQRRGILRVIEADGRVEKVEPRQQDVSGRGEEY